MEETRQCSKCGSAYPCTPKYFFRVQRGKFLTRYCKGCHNRRTAEIKLLKQEGLYVPRNKREFDFSGVSELDWAYLAGIVDGEGSLRIVRARPSTPTFSIQIEVASTAEELMLWLSSRFSGSFKSKVRKGHESQWCRYYVWVACSNLARAILPRVKPYLVIKARHAAVLTEMSALLTREHGGRYREVPKENLEDRLRLVSQIKDLNKRGAAKIAMLAAKSA